MNYHKKNTFLARLTGMCFGEGDSGDGGGGGGGGDGMGTGGDTGGSSASVDTGSQSTPAPAAPVSYTRDPTDPSLDWIKEIRAKGGQAQLEGDEVRALMNHGDGKKAKQKAAEAVAAAPAADPNAPAPRKDGLKFDEKLKRWKDANGKIVAAPKDAKPPKGTTPDPAPAPAAKTETPLTAEAVAAALAAAAKGNQPTPTPQPSNEPQALPEWYGKVTPAISIPKQLFEQIDSTDPETRMQGMNSLINGVLNLAMRDMLTKILPQYDQSLRSQMPAIMQAHTAQQEANRGFFTKYPALADPDVQPLVNAIGRATAAQWQQAKKSMVNQFGHMSEEFMDAVHANVQAKLGSLGFVQDPGNGGGQTPEGVVQSQTVVTPPVMARRGARPPAASPNSNKSAEIKGIIGFN